MKNKYKFEYPIEVVYKAISQMVLDNANVHAEHKYTIDKLDKVNYSYDIQTNMGSFKNYFSVVEVVENEKVSYTIHREKMEKYLVTFDLSDLGDNTTHLLYEFLVQSDKSTTSLNHSIISYLYRRKQVKKFKAMCAYLNQQCETLMSEVKS